MKADVVVIGCGVIGSAIAWELSRAGLSVIGLDRAAPATGSTGAALGVMAAIGIRRIEGHAAQLRYKSLGLLDPFIEVVEASSGLTIPVNRSGILHLFRDPSELDHWGTALASRTRDGHLLQPLQSDQIDSIQPHLMRCGAGLYSPQDRQVDPVTLTHGLIRGAARQGAQFYFHQPVTHSKSGPDRIHAIYTPQHTISASTVVVAAGLGSSSLGFGLPISIQAVKGQALKLYAPGIPIAPVVTFEDTHLVPLGSGELWIGATVEFGATTPGATVAGIQSLLNHAIEICPGLSEAELRSSWAGWRPRPTGQRAPILGFSSAFKNVIIATGHYRNGVLLAPITAAILKDLVLQGETTLCDLSHFAPQGSHNSLEIS